MPDSPVQTIEAWLAHPGWQQILPTLLAERYEQDIGPVRRRGVTQMLVVIAVAVAAYLSLGLLVEPAAFRAVAWTQLALIPPASLAVAWLIRLPMPVATRECLIAGAAALTGIAPILAFVASGYQYVPLCARAVMMGLVVTNLLLNLRSMHAVAVTGLIALCYAAAILFAPTTGGHVFDLLGSAGLYAAITLFASFQWEGIRLRHYARGLLEELRGEDLSEQNTSLEQIARSDTLTGLANRRAFDFWLASAWQQAGRQGEWITLIAIDIDHFKAFNDFNGHPAGDTCLQAIGRAMREQLRGAGDMVARIGGEEFMVVLPGLNARDGGDIAERLRGGVQALELPHLGIGPSGLVTISVGLASCQPQPGISPDTLIAAADAALYQAKQLGRNRVCAAEVEERAAAAPG